MKHIILIRHAKSDWNNEGIKDYDRPLNKRGIRDAPKMAEELKKLIPTIDYVISSPANRAITTCKIFCKEYGYNEDNIKIVEGIYYEGKSAIIKAIEGLPPSTNNVMIFGHNPDISMAATYLSNHPMGNMPTCSCVCSEYEIDDWSKLKLSRGGLKFFIYPKMHFSDSLD